MEIGVAASNGVYGFVSICLQVCLLTWLLGSSPSTMTPPSGPAAGSSGLNTGAIGETFRTPAHLAQGIDMNF